MLSLPKPPQTYDASWANPYSAAIERAIDAAMNAAQQANAWIGFAPINVKAAPYNAKGDGVTDDTTSVQAALTAASTSGGTVLFPPGTYLFSGAALTIAASGVVLQGSGRNASILRFTHATNNSLAFIGVTTIYGCGVRDLYISHANKTAGAAFALQKCADLTVERVTVGDAWNGMDLNEVNNVSFFDTQWAALLGDQFCKFYASGNGSTRSDVLTIVGGGVDMGSATGNGDGIVWDGFAHTLRVRGFGVVSARYGLWMKNTAASGAYYPSFGELVAVEFDGCETSIKMDAGSLLFLTSCDAFQAAGSSYVVDMAADAAASMTRQLKIVGGRYGGCSTNILRLAGQAWSVDNADVGDGQAAVPAISVLGAAADFRIHGVLFVWFGASANHTYGVVVAAGAARGDIGPNNYQALATGEVLDNSGTGTVRNVGGIGISGAPNMKIGTATGSSLALTGALDVGTTALWGAAGARGELSYTTAAAIVRSKGTNKLYLNYGDGSGGVEVYDGGGGLVGSFASATWTQPIDRGINFTNQTSGAGAQVGTLTNAPAAGNPAHWLKIKIAGVSYSVPCWPG